MKKATILRQGGKKKPVSMKIEAPEFVASLDPGDELWLMMGSTNASVALGASRRGAVVHQISHARALPNILALRNGNGDGGNNDKVTILAEDVLHLAKHHPDIFYSMYPEQNEVLAIIGAWQRVVSVRKVRIAYANEMRGLLQHQAVVSGNGTVRELKALIKVTIGTKDPTDPGMRDFLRQEKSAETALNKAMKDSILYMNVFQSIESVGPKIAARFMTAIERIERFPTPEDLMRFAGMLPTKDGKLPSRKRGGLVSRSEKLNNACFLLQEQMFGYGAKSEFGKMIHNQIDRECPCSQEERDADKDLRKKHSGAVKEARIAMTRVFLEQVWHGWREYMRIAAS